MNNPTARPRVNPPGLIPAALGAGGLAAVIALLPIPGDGNVSLV